MTASKRFLTRHENGSDWAVVDSRTGIVVASGLNDDEADQAADARNLEVENSEKSS